MYNPLLDEYTILKERIFENTFSYNQYAPMTLVKSEIIAEGNQKQGCH